MEPPLASYYGGSKSLFNMSNERADIVAQNSESWGEKYHGGPWRYGPGAPGLYQSCRLLKMGSYLTVFRFISKIHCRHVFQVGNANELNAAYAADAYCRIKGCPGVRKSAFVFLRSK